MAFLKSSQITGLSAKDVDVRGFTQAANIKLGDRAYTEHEVLLADSYSIIGDVTVSDNLILSKLSDDGDDITLTGDTTTRTISGSGSIEGATLAQTPNATLTGMTGTVGSGAVLGSAVTHATGYTLGSGVTFPTGHIIQVLSTTVTGIPSITSNQNWLDWPGLAVTITPSSTSSKIFVTASVNVSSNADTAQRLVRNSTAIGVGDVRGSRRQSTTGGNIHRSDHEMCQYSVNYLDSQNTTFATIYKMQGIDEGGATQSLNREHTDGDERHDSTGASTITVMEISA